MLTKSKTNEPPVRQAVAQGFARSQERYGPLERHWVFSGAEADVMLNWGVVVGKDRHLERNTRGVKYLGVKS